MGYFEVTGTARAERVGEGGWGGAWKRSMSSLVSYLGYDAILFRFSFLACLEVLLLLFHVFFLYMPIVAEELLG